MGTSDGVSPSDVISSARVAPGFIGMSASSSAPPTDRSINETEGPWRRREARIGGRSAFPWRIWARRSRGLRRDEDAIDMMFDAEGLDDDRRDLQTAAAEGVRERGNHLRIEIGSGTFHDDVL